MVITFPVTDEDELSSTACFGIKNTALTSIKQVKSLGYDPARGRTLALPAELAPFDGENFGSIKKTIRVLIN